MTQTSLSRSRPSGAILSTLFVLFTAACGGAGPGAWTTDAGDGGDGSTGHDGSSPAATDAAMPGPDAGAPVSQRVGPEGGEVAAHGLRLSIPPGALAEPTEITIELGQNPGLGFELYSRVWDLRPDGLSFAVPVTASMEFEGDDVRAAAFWSGPGGRVERLGGVVTPGRLTVEVAHFSSGFVADGVSFTTPPRHAAPDCAAVVRLVHGGPLPESSGVATIVAIEDCDGVPIRGLGSSDFVPLEDGSPLSVEAHAFTVMEHQSAIHFFVTLAIDLSVSADAFRPTVVEAARAFVDEIERADVPVHIGVLPFAGSVPQYDDAEFLPPTLEYPLVRQRIDALADLTLAAASSTSLRFATEQAHLRAQRKAAEFERRNRGGAFGVPLVVLFTDGRDTAGSEGSVPPGSALAIALKSADFDRAGLEALIGGPEHVANLLVLEDSSELPRDFARVAARLAARIDGAFYRVGYCSPALQGTHTFSVEVIGASRTHAEPFSFQPSYGECSRERFERACVDHECGGFGCGACDDREAVCNGQTCVNWCETLGVCDALTINNPLGHEQSCDRSRCAQAEQPTFGHHPPIGEPEPTVAAIGGWNVPSTRIDAIAIGPRSDVFVVGAGTRRYELGGQLVWSSVGAAGFNTNTHPVFSDSGDMYLSGGRWDAHSGEMVWSVPVEQTDFMLVSPDGRFGIARRLRPLQGPQVTWYDADANPIATGDLEGEGRIVIACGTSDGGFWTVHGHAEGPPTPLVARKYNASRHKTIEAELPSTSTRVGGAPGNCTGASLVLAVFDDRYGSEDKVLRVDPDGSVTTLRWWTEHGQSPDPTRLGFAGIHARGNVLAFHVEREWGSLFRETVGLLRYDATGAVSERVLLRSPQDLPISKLAVVGDRSVAVALDQRAGPGAFTLYEGEVDALQLGGYGTVEVMLLHDDTPEP